MNRKNPFADITDTHTDVDRYPKEGVLLSGRYRLLSIAGKGGMGLVYRAKDEHAADLGRGDAYLAIKVLSPLIREDEEAVVALKREAEMAKKLRHRNLLGVYGFETDGQWTYLISEWIDGETLSKKLLNAIGEGKDGLPWTTIKEWLPDIAEALDAAHQQGVIHRDIKPGNIMVTRMGRVVILDFGVSYQAGRTLSKLSNANNSSGTPEYIPPEVYLGGHKPVAKDDVYGLAVTIYKLLVNDEPYKELLITNRDETTPQPRKPRELSDRQWQCLMTALHHTPDKRPESAGAFVDTLLNDTKITEPKPKKTVWAVTLAALLGGSAIVASQHFPTKTVVDEPVKPSEQEKQDEAKKLADEAKKTADEKAKREAEAKAKQDALAKQLARQQAELAEAQRQTELAKKQAEAKKLAEEKTQREADKTIDHYTVHNNGTVTDTKTGLTWQRCTYGQTWNGSGCSGAPKKMTWHEVMKLNKNGWRLPTIAELGTIVYCSSGKTKGDWESYPGRSKGCKGNYRRPTINTAAFPMQKQYYYWDEEDKAKDKYAWYRAVYWSSSPNADNSNSAWVVNFYDGNDYNDDKFNNYYVRLVRGGQ